MSVVIEDIDTNKNGTKEKKILPPVKGEYYMDGVRIPYRFPKHCVDKVKASKFKADDVFVVAFSKSGQHWIKDIISLVLNHENIEKTSSVPILKRAPLIDIELPGNNCPVDHFAEMPSPRVFSTHMNFNVYKHNIENSQCRVVALMRNPKDVLVSFYHFHRAGDALGSFKGSWNDFFMHRMTEDGFFGSWFDQVLGYWLPNRENPNYLFVKYEDFHIDGVDEVKRLAKFLKIDIGEDEIKDIVKICSFDEQKKKLDEYVVGKNSQFNSKMSAYFRKGKVGDWKNYFTVAQNELFNELYEKKMKDSGLKFDFEI